MCNFSLSFSLAKVIYTHHTEPSTYNKVIRFCQQELLDRILGASISALALLDISFHLTAAAIKGLKACYSILKSKEGSSFKESIRHLKLAYLFSSVLRNGSFLFISNPFMAVRDMFKSPLMEFVTALLLSGNPEVFQDSSEAGNTSIQPHEVLDEFLFQTQNIPKNIQDSMHNTLALVQEARDCLKEFSLQGENIIRRYSFHSFYKKVIDTFDRLILSERNSWKQVILTEVTARVYILGLAALSIPLSLISAVQTVVFLNLIFISLILDLDKRDLKVFKRLLGLNILSAARCLLAVPACLTLGLFFPYQVQSLLFSLLYKKTINHQSIEKILKKIEHLAEGKSFFIPLDMYVKNPLQSIDSHCYYIVLTKHSSHYQLSIINRGFGSNLHIEREKNKSDADYSWINVNFNFLKNYLTFLLKCQNTDFATKVFNGCKNNLPNNYNLFLGLIYDTPSGVLKISYKDYSLTKIENPIPFISRHSRSHQKIGNCAVSSLLGAISFHSAMQTGNLQDKRIYKIFIYTYKKMMLEKYDYLLDFSLSPLKTSYSLSTFAYQKLDKAKQKLSNVLLPEENFLMND